MYQNLTKNESVHLTVLPTVDEAAEQFTDADKQLVATMQHVREIVSAGLAVRAQAGIKVRQPLAEIVVPETDGLTEDILAMMADELNVKSIVQGELPKGDGIAASKEDEKVRVVLRTELTTALLHEGIARDIIRHGQQLRRKAGYELDDRITLSFTTDDEQLQAAFDSQQDMITKALQVDAVVDSADGMDVRDEVKAGGAKAALGVKK